MAKTNTGQRASKRIEKDFRERFGVLWRSFSAKEKEDLRWMWTRIVNEEAVREFVIKSAPQRSTKRGSRE
jgi:hypothetical protein